MAKIHPFKAIRPTRDKAQLVSTRPLAAYRKHILKAKLDENPYTFLHIIHPEEGKYTKTKINSPERFHAVKQRYESFIDDGILFQDTAPSIYIYRQTKGNHAFTGVIAGVSIDEYQNNKIKKHEATLTSREAMFTEYLDVTGFNAEPVLLSHEHSEPLDEFLAICMQPRPEYEFSTTDRIRHELWQLTTDQTAKMVEIYAHFDAFYIADGHHRSASSSRLKDKKIERHAAPFPNHDFFMAYLIDEQKLEIVEFNRLVKHLNELSEEQFLNALTTHFTVTLLKKERKPEREHEIICILGKRFFSLQVNPQLLENKDVVKCLDAQLLTDCILEPILGIKDLKTSPDISFIPGTKGLKALKDPISKGDAMVGFVLFPLHVSQVKAVADEGKIMPPKSTWVEPKMRSGLTIYKINE